MTELKVSDPSDLKRKLADAFGQRAQDYIKFAVVQRQAAQYLSDMVEDILPELPSPYIELGCGTGFVTEKILPKLSPGSFLVTDISEEMLSTCRQMLHIPEGFDVSFEIVDAEEFHQPDSYGLIVTALTAQWFEDTHGVLIRLLESLKPGGLLVYSYLDECCFPEWKALCAESGLPYTGNELPTSRPIDIDFNRYSWEYASNELFTEEYPSLADFFRNLKRIGAGTRKSPPSGSYGTVLALNEFWTRKAQEVFRISYGISFGAIRRKPEAI